MLNILGKEEGCQWRKREVGQGGGAVGEPRPMYLLEIAQTNQEICDDAIYFCFAC